MNQVDQEAAKVMHALLVASQEDPFVLGDRRLAPGDLVTALQPFLSPGRKARIDGVLDGRTRTVVPVVEGLINTGNVSAVMRTAEALGFYTFHVVTGKARYKTSSRTAQGSDKWLDMFTWPSTSECVAHLKQTGYMLVATHLDDTAVPIDEIDFTEKTALIFGNEFNGVSEEMLSLADRRCVIPTHGFVQSFNISVAAAVALYHAYRDRLRRQGRHGDLTEAERAHLRAVYYYRAVKNAPGILRRAFGSGGHERPGT